VSLASAFLEAAIRTMTPLLFAATGELLVERAGLINIGLEGIILGGAFGAVVGATHAGVAGGVVGAVIGGLLFASLFLAFVVYGRADQIVTGAAVTLFAIGTTGALYRSLYGNAGAALSIPTMGAMPVPGLDQIPVIGTALFAQPPLTYLAVAVAGAVWWWFARTHAGLAHRATGESPIAAASAGISVTRVRTVAILCQGILGGLAGGTLVLAQSGTFVEGMSAGRGFVAIAIVVLGRWHPMGVTLASFVFAAATALQFLLQALDTHLPYHVILAIPYVLTLLALAGVAGRVQPPAALARGE
jgi:ABC-type uncharacterized transport system permease subunit